MAEKGSIVAAYESEKAFWRDLANGTIASDIPALGSYRRLLTAVGDQGAVGKGLAALMLRVSCQLAFWELLSNPTLRDPWNGPYSRVDIWCRVLAADAQVYLLIKELAGLSRLATDAKNVYSFRLQCADEWVLDTWQQTLGVVDRLSLSEQAGVKDSPCLSSSQLGTESRGETEEVRSGSEQDEPIKLEAGEVVSPPSASAQRGTETISEQHPPVLHPPVLRSLLAIKELVGSVMSSGEFLGEEKVHLVSYSHFISTRFSDAARLGYLETVENSKSLLQ